MSTKVTRQSRTIELAGTEVPSILFLPHAAHPVPAVLLLHAYSSTKERLADSMGRSLAARGIGSLAIDLPLHGSRDDAIIHEARTNPLELMRHWKMALAEAAAALTWLGAQDAIDAQHLNVAGYSLGSYIALQTAASDERVVSVIVAAAAGHAVDRNGADVRGPTEVRKVVAGSSAAHAARSIRSHDSAAPG